MQKHFARQAYVLCAWLWATVSLLHLLSLVQNIKASPAFVVSLRPTRAWDWLTSYFKRLKSKLWLYCHLPLRFYKQRWSRWHWKSRQRPPPLETSLTPKDQNESVSQTRLIPLQRTTPWTAFLPTTAPSVVFKIMGLSNLSMHLSQINDFWKNSWRIIDPSLLQCSPRILNQTISWPQTN